MLLHRGIALCVEHTTLTVATGWDLHLVLLVLALSLYRVRLPR